MGVYCDPEDVQEYLQDSVPFSTTTNPTRAAVERLIESVESEIDDRTKHSWRPRRVFEEYHTPRYATGFRFGLPTPFIKLEHWQVKALSNAAGDKLEIWRGNVYQDWIDPAESKTHGRAEDYFLIAREGEIYFPRSFPIRRWTKGIRVTYHYGDPDVSGTVHKLATMMVAKHLLRADHRILVAAGGPQGPQTPAPSTTADQLGREIEKLFADTSWIRSPRTRFRISGGPHGR